MSEEWEWKKTPSVWNEQDIWKLKSKNNSFHLASRLCSDDERARKGLQFIENTLLKQN